MLKFKNLKFKRFTFSVFALAIIAALIFSTIFLYPSSGHEGLTDKEKYPVTQSMLTPNGNSWWGTDTVVYSNASGSGTRIAFQKPVPFAYRHQFNTPLPLDGLHLNLTLNSADYYSRMFYIMLSSASGSDNRSGALAVKFDTGGGQLFGLSDGAAIDHSGLEGYNPAHTDRVFTPALSNAINTYDIKFRLNANGSLTMSVNSYDFIFSADDVLKAAKINDLSKVYMYIAPESGALDVTLNSFHGKNSVCYDDAALTSDKEKYAATDAALIPNLTTNWWSPDSVNYTNLPEGGVRVAYVSQRGFEYRHQTASAVPLNGMHMNLTLNRTDYWSRIYYLKLTGKNIQQDASDALVIKVDTDGRQLSGNINGAAIDHSAMPGYNSAFPNRTFVGAEYLDSTIHDYDFYFTANLDGSISMDLNGYIYTVKAEDVAKASGLSDLSEIYMYIMPENSNGSILDYTLKSFHGGNKYCYDRGIEPLEDDPDTGLPDDGDDDDDDEDNEEDHLHNDSAHYPVRASELYPNQETAVSVWGWNVSHTELPNKNLRITYNSSYPSPYTQAIKSVKLDGLHYKMNILNGSSFWLTLGHQQRHPGNGNPLSLHADTSSGNLTIGYGTTFETINDISALKSKNFDLRILKNEDGLYVININGYEYVISEELYNLASDFKINAESSGEAWLNLAPDNNALSVDILSLHGGSHPCYDDILALYGVEGLEKVDGIIAAISSIGNVTVDSTDAIAKARAEYQSLPDLLKGLVTNYQVLVTAEKDFDHIQKDRTAAISAIVLIDNIKSVTLKDKDIIAKAYAAYLDLYPRQHKYVTNYAKLEAALAAYANLDPETDMKAYTLSLYPNPGVDPLAITDMDTHNSPLTGDYRSMRICAVVFLCAAAVVLKLSLKNKEKQGE